MGIARKKLPGQKPLSLQQKSFGVLNSTPYIQLGHAIEFSVARFVARVVIDITFERVTLEDGKESAPTSLQKRSRITLDPAKSSADLPCGLCRIGDTSNVDGRPVTCDGNNVSSGPFVPMGAGATVDGDTIGVAFGALIKNAINIACPSPAAHNQKTFVLVELSQAPVLGSPVAKIGEWRFELCNRNMTHGEKLTHALEWQSRLVYGPDYVRHENGEIKAKTDRWSARPKELCLSATGNTWACIPCSPFSNAFLGYWFNKTEQEFASEAGASNEALVNAYQPFLERLAPECNIEHRHGKKLNTCPAQAGAGQRQWHWQAFYNYLMRTSQVGDIYLCGSMKHSWLVLHLGPGFNVPRRLIFGSAISRPHNDCDAGIFQVHASGPGPIEFLRAQYSKDVKTGKASLDKLIEILEAGGKFNPNDIERPAYQGNQRRSPLGCTYHEVFLRLHPRLIAARDGNSKAPVKIFNGTPLTLVNGRVLKVVDTRPEVPCAAEPTGIAASSVIRRKASLVADRGVDLWGRGPYVTELDSHAKETWREDARFTAHKLVHINPTTGRIDPTKVKPSPKMTASELQRLAKLDCRRLGPLSLFASKSLDATIVGANNAGDELEDESDSPEQNRAGR